MTFFYAIIGILLFSSISIINRYILLFYGSNFHSKSFLSIDAESKQVDKFVISKLHEGRDFGEGDDLCFNIKKELKVSGISKSSKIDYIFDGITKSKHRDIINSCVLTDGSHRMLIKKKTNSPIFYSFNSCYLVDDIICSFEKGELD